MKIANKIDAEGLQEKIIEREGSTAKKKKLTRKFIKKWNKGLSGKKNNKKGCFCGKKTLEAL